MTFANELDKPYGTQGDALSSWDNLASAAKPYPPARLRYIQVADVTGLSYSKLSMLHECPRKYHLQNNENRGGFTPNIHLAFGHAYGAGVQTYIHYHHVYEGQLNGQQLALERAIVAALAAWDMYDLNDYDINSGKDFGSVVQAIKIFAIDSVQLLQDYSIYMMPLPDGTTKAANELLVYVQLTDSYSFQMHIDTVLQDRVTGELAVLEVKTGSRPFEQSDYSNSAQSMGYCVALQAKFGLNKVQHKSIYVCYDSKKRDTYIFEFVRDLSIGMEWAATTMLDVEQIERYRENDFWPRRGQSCKSFNRPCKFFGNCNLMQYAQPALTSYEADGIEAADIVVASEQILALINQ